VQWLTNLGSGFVLLPLALALMVLLYRLGRTRDAVFIALVAGGSIALVYLTKDLVDRPRPPMALVQTESFSFPSAHAGDALAVYGASAHALGRRAGLGVKAGLWLVAALVAGFVGWTRLYLGVHYPSDVVGGYVLAGGWLAAVTLALRRLAGSEKQLDAVAAPG
jgi:undecaprenyl-diphosphatase